MNENQNKNIWYAVIVVSLIIILATRKKRKDIEILVKGEYTVPPNVANRADALHSFERRKSDGFGGRMTTKIREAMLSLYQQGINPDVQDIKIIIDSTKYKVNWEAKVVPSKDGKAYVGLSTVGSAGAGYTGSKGDIGYTGSKGDIGYTGSIPAAITATSLALGGATLGTHNLAVSGTTQLNTGGTTVRDNAILNR
jgi:hypothetical protein